VAYYRFRDMKDEFSQDIEAERTNSEGDEFNFPVPSNYDEHAVNDICFSGFNFLEVPEVTKSKLIPMYDLNLKYKRAQTKYGYTVSMWIQIYEDTPTESSTHKALTKSQIIGIKESFYCFMSSSHELACFVEGVKEYLGKRTKSVTVPHRQWVNV
jgi:hypothetical protein